MTDNKRTCGDCAWWKTDRSCNSPTCQATYEISYMGKDSKADDCETFRSHSDQALIDESHRLRSLGAAVEWSKIDRLVEIAAGRELERGKRCDVCGGEGNIQRSRKLSDCMYDIVYDCCEWCHGTGYQKGGERCDMKRKK